MLTVMLLIIVAEFALGVPIAFAIGGGVLAYLLGTDIAPTSLITQEVFTAYDNLILTAVPLFMFTGLLMTEAGLTSRLIDFSNSLVGRVRGGLAHVNVISNVVMSGISGASTSDAAAIGSVLIPAMVRSGYPKPFAAAITAAAATLGPVIPPSIPILVYCAFADVSVGRALLAGVMPGFFMAGAMLVINYWLAVTRDYPLSEEPFSAKRAAREFVRVSPVLGVTLIIIGGVVSGIFTATEASAVAALLVIVLGIFVYRVLTWRAMRRVALQSVVLTGTIMAVLGLAKALAWILTRERVAAHLSGAMTVLGNDPTMFLLVLTVVLLVMGCFLDATPIMIIVLPVVLPVATALHVDLVHMGIVVVLALMIGLLTPPVGLTAMLVCSMANLRMSELVRECWPYWLGILACIVFVIFFPGSIMWVPNLLMN
jgi:tripartite ATP-independent transporter DctM subunit